jgi:hypothetical protein
MMKRSMSITAAILAAIAGQAAAQVQHGAIEVIENDCDNTSASVTLLPLTGDGAWTLISDDGTDSSSKGDYVVDFASGADAARGVLITGSYEDARTSDCLLDPYFTTFSSARSGSGRYWIAAHGSPSGSEVNSNPAFAYFPIADGWMTAAAYNSENGGIITELVGNPNIPLYNLFNDPGAGNGFIDTGTGTFGLRLDGIDMRRDGVFLASGAKNEDNFAQVYLNYDGSGVINSHDNGSNGDTSEQDPVACVFVPEGTPGVTMGVVTGCADTLFRQGDFTVELVGRPDTSGTFRLEIAGENPSTGTLVVSPTTEFGGNTIDNPVFVVPDATGWEITTRDIAGMGLQNIGSYDRAFHFAFFKTGVDIAPGVPSKSYLPRLGHAHAARIALTEIRPDNENGDMIAERAMGSDAITAPGDNRGDVGMAFFNARHPAKQDNSLDAYEGVYLVSSSEFLRDNSGTGGVSGWTTCSFDNGEMHAHNASLAGGEINSDFAVAFFPTEAGFDQNGDIQVLEGETFEQPVNGVAGVDGVVIAINWDNNNRVVNAVPNGNAYTLSAFEASGGAPSLDWDFGYVWFPYETPDLVAGQVSAAGAVVSGTGNFSVAAGSDQTYGFPLLKITVPGVDARTDGVLMLTGTDGAYAMSWEPGEDGTFEVAGFDLASENPERAGFNFVYVSYEGLVAGDECVADFNGDGAVDTRDVIAFLNAWNADDSSADIDGNGTVDTRDVIAYLNLWTAGC